jgi:hypothetical protein
LPELRLAALAEFLDAIPRGDDAATIRAIAVMLHRTVATPLCAVSTRSWSSRSRQACDEIGHALRKLGALALRGDVNEALVRVAPTVERGAPAPLGD